MFFLVIVRLVLRICLVNWYFGILLFNLLVNNKEILFFYGGEICYKEWGVVCIWDLEVELKVFFLYWLKFVW